MGLGPEGRLNERRWPDLLPDDSPLGVLGTDGAAVATDWPHAATGMPGDAMRDGLAGDCATMVASGVAGVCAALARMPLTASADGEGRFAGLRQLPAVYWGASFWRVALAPSAVEGRSACDERVYGAAGDDVVQKLRR